MKFPIFLQILISKCLEKFDFGAVHRSALCRSRRELSNASLLAKIGVDTAENEPLEVWGKIIQYFSFVSLRCTLAPPAFGL